MEAVRKRPARQRATKKQEQRQDREASDDEQLHAAITELDAVQEPPASDSEIRRNEEDLMALLQGGGAAKEQELLVAEGSGSQPSNNHNNDKDQGQKKVSEQEHKENKEEEDQVTATTEQEAGTPPILPVIPTMEGDLAPSAPVFEEEETVGASPEQLPLQPRPSAPPPPPPVRTSMPHAFHEISVAAGVETAAPSAPPEFEDDVVIAVADHSSTTPSAPSLSPTTSKKVLRVSPRNPEKMSPVVRMPVKEAAVASVEGTSVAVRNSFAKSHEAEKKAGLHSVYPSMPREEAKTAEILSKDGVAGEAPASYEQLLKKKHIRVKLEPFVNYEMNLMRAEASQKRQEMKMRHIETNKGELYARIERYLFSEYILHNAASTMDEYKKKIDVLVKKVWTLEKKRVSSTKRCGDNVEIEQQMEFQTAKLETLQLEKLKTHLDKLRQLRTVEASMHTFDRAISYFHVEQYLNSVLQEPTLVAFLNKMSSSCGGSSGIDDLDLVPEGANFYEGIPQGSPLASSVDHLKYCLDVLIFFEKKVTLGEEGVFGRVPQSFFRGELIWHSTHANMHHSAAGGAGMGRKIKCYACGSLNAPMKSNQWCKLCESCDVVLYLPPSSVSTKSNEWFTSVLRFRQSLQKWISTCLQKLMRTKALQNMPYLLMHVMYLPRISTDERSWFLRFLQFPRAMVRTDGSLRNEWSEDLVDHYIAMLHLVFHPEKLRRMSIIVSSGPPNGAKTAKSVDVGVPDSKGLVSPEWVLLENPEMLDRYFLSDDDFVAVLNQFPNAFAFEQLFRCTSDVKKCFSRALTLVLELTHSLRAFQEFEKLPTRIAQLLGQLLADAAELRGSGRPSDAGMKDAVFYPTLFDQLFLTSLHGLMTTDCNRVAWKSLNLFPFGSLSDLAKWDVLALLLFNLHSLPLEAKTASGWMQFIGKPTSQGVDTGALARQHLYDLIESDTDSAMYLLNAVASLAASCQASDKTRLGERNDLVSVAVHELFMAGYTVESCKHALGENGERAAGPLSTICLAHPWVLSLLIALLFKYHECAATWIHVFETFPINRWMPTPQDLLNLQEWLLLEDTTAPRSALARFLLDHINWEYDVKQQRLFTNAMLHRQVALMVAEALVLYKTRQERASDPESAIVLSGGGSPQKLEVTSIAKSIRRALWLGETVDFEKWCWKLMLKLRFYSPKTQEPLLPLIDLRHDRSREALTLRRWFAGASVIRILPSRKVFPFYTSLEEQVSRYGASGNDSDSSPQAQAGGSTGAPIQQEGRMLLTPQNPKGGGGADIVSTVSATAAPRTEPIVAYVICQMTTFVFSDRLDRWEPLLVLLKSEFFPAAIKVLENLFPILSRLDKTKDFSAKSVPASAPHPESENESKTATSNSEDDGEVVLSSEEVDDEVEVHSQNGGVLLEIDNELEVCMAAMQALSTDELLSLLKSLHEFSYINTDELHRMQEVLNKGYIGGWEGTAKERILAKLRFVRECSRYLHPVVLPALINECFPQSSPVSVTTSALFHGAMSWISSALGGENSAGALSPSAASSTSAALSIRNSSLTAAASLAIIAGSEYSSSTKSLCALIRRSFEYSVDDMSLADSMRFWMKALLQVPFWYENAAFRHVLDVMLHCSMESSYELSSKTNATTGHVDNGVSYDILYELVGLVEAAYGTFCQRIARREDEAGQPEQQFFENEPVVVLSFLPAVAASASFASIFGGSFDVAQYVSGCPYLALWSLLIETRKEVPLFLTMGQLMIKYEPKTMKKLEKMKKTEGRLTAALNAVRCGKSLDDMAEDVIYEAPNPTSRVENPLSFGHTSLDSLSQYKIYRWCNYCLDLPESEPTQIIYWQVFFALYFATAGGSHVFGHHFLDRLGGRSAKRVHLRKHLQTKLRKLVNYCSNQAQVVLTATAGSGGDRASSGVGSAAELKERRYAHFVALSQLYTAMDAWMEEKDPNQWLKEEEMSGLPRHYEVERLKDVLRLSDVLLNSNPDQMNWSHLPLWTNWCGFEFTVRRTTPQVASSSESDAKNGAVVPSLSAPLATGEEDDFAFVEEASELARRHSSFGGLVGAPSLNVQPLSLVADLCGPASLTQLPTVSLIISPERCAVTPSIPLNKAGLKAVTMKFSENLSVLVALDSEMVDSVSQLYISKARTVTQSLPCAEGANCNSPAAFRFEFLEWMMDSRMDDTIQSIRAQGDRCDMQSMVAANVMSALSEHDEASPASTAMPFAAEQFLQLDGDGFMLSLQILLIDQVVRTLDLEHQKLQRLKQTLESEAPLEDTNEDELVSAGTEEGSGAVTSMGPEGEALTPMDKVDKQTECLHNKGLEWFRLLTELDTKLSRMVPPLREALWRSIKQLGLGFVCVDERETCTLLQLMLEDPSRINLLSECFFPAAAPSRFVEMFAKLMSSSSSARLTSEEKLTLLRRFDFRVWLQTKSPHTPTKFDRDTVLCMILGDISHQFPADRTLVDSGRKAKDKSASEHLDEVLRVYAKVLQLICSANLEDHVEKMVHALVGVHDDYRFQTSTGGESTSSVSGEDENSSALGALPRPVDPVVWEALVGIPIASWKELPRLQIEGLVTFLSQHMTSLRWQGGLSSSGSSSGVGSEVLRGREASNAPSAASLAKYPIVYWQRLGVLKGYLDLFTLCCRVAPEQEQWQLITAFFEPLLSTLYQPATNTDGSAINAPWSEQDTLSTGTTICSCFVATCSEYLKSQPSAGPVATSDLALTQTAKLSQIWSFYLAALVPHAPTHICKHFHQFVTRLAWEHWCLTLEIVQQMRELVQTEKQQLAGLATGASDQLVPPTHSTLSPYPFVSWLVRDVLCRTTWKSTDAWLAAQSEVVCSSFLVEFAKLCLELVLDLPHFQLQSGHAASTNVLPPYFVNFIKQQSAFWAKWKMTMSDLEVLRQFTLEALKEPLASRASSRSSGSLVSTGPFPTTPSAAMMQDAFTRLQLVLRLFGQITTLQHEKLPRKDSLQRVNVFLKLLFGVFEVNDRGCLDGNRYSSEHAAWLMVLYGSSCTALYEKLDEIVHFYKPEAGREEGPKGVEEARDGVSEEDLTATIEGVLRLCNLSLVEVFFKQMQSSPKAGSGAASSSSSGSGALNWNKCGNVVFVEIDGLVRDFASSQKALQQRSYRGPQASSDRNSDKEEEVVVSATQSPAESIGKPLGKVLWSFLAFRGGELACLAACGRALASVHVMSQVAEKSIEKWIIEERRGMWDALALRLQVPELSGDEFEAACLEQGKLLTLQVLFLQQLRRAPVLTESLSLALLTKLMGWMERARVGSSTLAQMKLLFLAAEVTNFVCKPLAEVLPSTLKKQMLRQVCDLLLELGHARRNNGIMKAIGLGGSLQYGVEFHVSCLAAGIFLRLQTRNGAPLRVDDRIPFKMTRTTEKHLRSLESMLQSKDAFQLGRRADALVSFARDPRRSLADQDEFFVTLFSSMYPSQGWLLAKCLP